MIVLHVSPFSLLNSMSYIKLFWISMTTCVFVPAAIALKWPKFWPFLNDLVKYGKSQSNAKSFLHTVIEVPKKWFSHFYILASCWSFICFAQLILLYWFDSKPASFWSPFLQRISAPNSGRTIDEFSAFLTMAVFWAHTTRRLFESLFVSVYSNTKMNILHYAAGLAHYTMIPLTILSETPGLATSGKYAFNFNALSYAQIVGLILFTYASYAQHRCFLILSDMRKNHLGNITNYAHGIPVTYYFDVISCPHFAFEILIYVSLHFTLNCQHSSWPYAALFVLINQILAALITHGWYKEKYKEMYPSQRKAIMPFVL